MKKLSKKNKIKILHLALNTVTDKYNYNGMCHDIIEAGVELELIKTCYAWELIEQFPDVNYPKAIEYHEKYGNQKPHDKPENNDKPCWWWNKSDKQPRIEFINTLIKELQNK